MTAETRHVYAPGEKPRVREQVSDLLGRPVTDDEAQAVLRQMVAFFKSLAAATEKKAAP